MSLARRTPHPSSRGTFSWREKAHRRPSLMISAVSVTAVEGFEVAHVRGERGPERVRIDGPPGLVLGVPVTMLFDQSVQKFEEVPGRAQIAQSVFERVIADRFVNELAQAGPVVVCGRVFGRVGV